MADKRIFDLTEEGFLDDITDKVYMWLDKKANEGDIQEPSWKFKADVFLKILNNFATKFVPNVATVEGKCYWHGGNLFVCNVAYTGDWVPGNFTLTSVDELFARKDVLSELQTDLETTNSNVTSLTTYAQNVAHSLAPEFDPTRDSEHAYPAGYSVTYTDGKVYTFKVSHYGQWDATDVRIATISDFLLLNGSNDFNSVAGNIVLVNGIYYAVTSSTTTIPANTSSNVAFSCASMFVKSGQKYKITCTGTSSALPFAFFDSTGAAVYKHTSVNARGLEYTFPSDGIAIFNNVNNSSVAYDIHLITPNEEQCDNLSGNVDVLERDNESLYSGLKLETGYYYAITSSTSTMPANHTASTGWESLKIPVKAGESYSVTSRSSSSGIPWSLWKSNGDLVSNSGSVTNVSGAVVDVEYDGYLIINSITSYGNSVYKRTRMDKKEISIHDKLLYWTMAEAYVLDGAATYTDGLIDSPVKVTMPDGTAANLMILNRTSEGLITQMKIQSVAHGVLITLALTRDADGNVTAMTIS